MVVESGNAPIKGFEFEAVGGENATQAVAHFRGFSAARHSVHARRPMRGTISLSANTVAIKVSLKGSTLFHGTGLDHTRVCVPHGAGMTIGPARYSLMLSRGEHDAVLFVWQREAMKALADWIDQRSLCLNRRVFSTSLSGRSDEFWEELQNMTSKQGDKQQKEAKGMTMIHALASEIGGDEERTYIALRPSELTEPVARLVESVQTEPARAWSLEEAAIETEYSPYHLSRLFRSKFGYGFPEFVERIRTECAIKLMLNSAIELHDVADQCGFRSVYGLRTALKQFLGFLPSEIHSPAPDRAIAVMRDKPTD